MSSATNSTSRLLAADATLARASGTEIMEAITELSRYLTGTELQGMRVTDQIDWQLPDDPETGAPGWTHGWDEQPAPAPAATDPADCCKRCGRAKPTRGPEVGTWHTQCHDCDDDVTEQLAGDVQKCLVAFETQEIEHDTDVAVLATFSDGRTYGIGTIQRPTSPTEFCNRVQALWREVRHQWPEAVG